MGNFRLQSLYMSSDQFPTSLVLILNEEEVVGHLKLTELRVGGSDVMVESGILWNHLKPFTIDAFLPIHNIWSVFLMIYVCVLVLKKIIDPNKKVVF